tara:strand:- start:271 stop:639 length:369 start_codon:yes stop_codon:yes gene_type:complete
MDNFLSDETINNLNNNLLEYNKKVYKYLKLIKQYEYQIKIYNKLIIDIKLEINKLKIVYNKYNNSLTNIENFLCKICFESYSDCIIMPCMHFNSCEKCLIKMNDQKCPFCRISFDKYIKVFL